MGGKKSFFYYGTLLAIVVGKNNWGRIRSFFLDPELIVRSGTGFGKTHSGFTTLLRVKVKSNYYWVSPSHPGAASVSGLASMWPQLAVPSTR